MLLLLKKVLILCLLAGLPMLAAGQGGPPGLPGQGQNGNQQAGNVGFSNTGSGTSATIVTPLAITKLTDLDFGNIVSSAFSGTVTLPPALSPIRITTGGVVIPTAIAGIPTAAAFSVTGEANATFSIILPASVILTRLFGTETIEVYNFVPLNGQIGTLNSTGQGHILLGATMDVDANQFSGMYLNQTGLTITVAYN